MAGQKVRDAGSQWIEEHWAELERDHSNEWVAADGNGLIAHASDYGLLLQEIAKDGQVREGVSHALIPAGTVQ